MTIFFTSGLKVLLLFFFSSVLLMTEKKKKKHISKNLKMYLNLQGEIYNK